MTSPNVDSPPSAIYTDKYSGDGFEPGNSILAGSNNKIINSMRCTVINGASNIISDKFNTHILGNYIQADMDNKFYIGCVNGAWIGGDLQVIGDISAEGDITAANFSDERLKDDISLIENPLLKIMSLDAVEFNWNNKQSTHQGHDIGLIAQQVEKIAPEIVQEKKSGYKALKYEKIIPLLVGAIQEQQSKIDDLELLVKELSTKVNSMN